MRSTGCLVPVRVWVSYESVARGRSVRNHPKHLDHMKQRARAGLGVVRVNVPWEVRMKSPKYGHMKLPSSSRAPYGFKTRESVGNPTTCRASPQDVSTRKGAIELVAES